MRVATTALVVLSMCVGSANSQVSSIKPGVAAVTCYGGDPNGTPLPGAYVAGLIDVSNPAGMPWYALWQMPPKGALQDFHSNNWTSKTLGQVFGIALGDYGTSDVFVTSTAIYGGSNTANFDNLFSKNTSGGYQFGAVWRLNPTGGLTNGDYELVADLKNDGAGLGQITYNARNKLLYVSNFFDGAIYTVGAPGNVGLGYKNIHSSVFTVPSPATTTISSIRPGALTISGSKQIAANGKRIWAVGYNPIEHRLYYGVVHGDYHQAKPTGALLKQNEIRSVGLDNSTGFINSASDKTEFFLPAYPSSPASAAYATTAQYSWPPSDIAFSTDGKFMAIAERGDLLGQSPMTSGTPANGAHSARVLSFAGSSSNWTTDDPIGSTGPLGTYNGHLSSTGAPLTVSNTNSAGGVDFGDGYSSTPAGFPDKLDATNRDGFIWSTTNSYQTTFYEKDSSNLNYVVGSTANMVYGAQGAQRSDVRLRQLPASAIIPGNPPHLQYVDFDGILTTLAKNQIGDIEMRRTPATPPLACACASVESFALKDGVLNARICASQLDFASVTVVQGTQILTPVNITPALPMGGQGPYCADVQVNIGNSSPMVVFELATEADATTQISQCCKSPEIKLALPK